MFDSHLGQETSPLGDPRKPHARIVRGEAIPQHTGGSQGHLDGAPDQRMPTVRGLPASAQHWEGSDAHYRSGELPMSTPDGSGFRGSTAICSASDLEKIDGRRRPDANPQDHLPTEPGAYALDDGRVLIVGPNGQQQIITRAQFDAWMAQQQGVQQQAAPPQQRRSIMAGVLRAVGR